MNSKLDWESFLNLEKEFWLRDKERICSDWWLAIKKERTNRLKEWLSRFVLLNEQTTILQIGPGAEGMINFLDIGQRYAIDPLADFFKKEFNQILDSSVTFTYGVGENLPYEDGMFDVVIIYNALDHTSDRHKVLSEIRRVLRDGGIFHVAVHTYSEISLPFFKLLGYVQRESEHPSRYTIKRINNDLRANSFQILDTRHGGRDESSIPDWFSLSPQLRAARLIGLCAPMLHILAKNKSG